MDLNHPLSPYQKKRVTFGDAEVISVSVNAITYQEAQGLWRRLPGYQRVDQYYGVIIEYLEIGIASLGAKLRYRRRQGIC